MESEAAVKGLEELDQVDWNALEHAYGPASDVPEIIRALAGRSKEVRDKALRELYGNIWHQGTVYDATAHAVPFLVGLVANQGVEERHEILVLLSHLAAGNSYHDVHQHSIFFEERKGDPALEATIETELGWVRQARDAVARGIEAYLGCLDDPGPEVRSAAAYVLATIPDHARDSLGPIRARAAQEHDPCAKASLLLCLGVLGGSAQAEASQPSEDLGTLWRDDPAPIVRLCGAMATVLVAGKTAPAAAVEALVEAIRNPEPMVESWRRLPWHDAGLEGDVSHYLVRTSAEPELVVDLLLAALETANGLAALSLAESLLDLAFEGRAATESGDAPFAALSALQQRLVTALATSNAAWIFNANLGGLLGAYGLPATPEHLQDYAGVARRPVGRMSDLAGSTGGIAVWRAWLARLWDRLF